MTEILIVVVIAGYEPRLVTLNRSRHDPDLVGITKREPEMRHLPEMTDQLLLPFDGVVTIDDKLGFFFTLNDVDLTLKPGTTFTIRESTDRTPALFTANT